MAETDQELLEADDLLAPTPEEKLAEYFAGLGSDSGITINVSEIDQEDRNRRGFLFYVPFEDMSSDELLTTILDKYGPGEYEATAKDAAGKFKFRQRFVLGSVRKQRPTIPGPKVAEPAPAPAGTTDPDILRVIEGQNRMIEALVANAPAAAGPPKSLLEQLAELGPALGALKDFIAPAAETNVLQTVRDALKLRDELGGGEPSDPLSEAVKSLMPVITKAVDRLDSADRGSRARAFRTAADLGGVGTPATATPGAEPMPTMPAVAPDVAILSMYLGPVLGWAAAGQPAAAAARQVGAMINGLPDDGFLAVLTFLEDEAPVDRLAEIDPRVNDHREWFAELVAGVIALFPEDAENLAPGAPVVVDSTSAESPGEPIVTTQPGPDTS